MYFGSNTTATKERDMILNVFLSKRWEVIRPSFEGIYPATPNTQAHPGQGFTCDTPDALSSRGPRIIRFAVTWTSRAGRVAVSI